MAAQRYLITSASQISPAVLSRLSATTLSKEDKERLNAILPYVRFVPSGVGGKPTIQFTGANVQVVSGSGATDGPVNGAGNLVIGYDESPGEQTGSNNLVVGTEQTYTSWGSVLAGEGNRSSSHGGVVFGYRNLAAGEYDAVTAGSNNVAKGAFSAVSGGQSNEALPSNHETGSSVSGGYHNVARGLDNSVAGGTEDAAGGEGSFVAGGFGNAAYGPGASVLGGSKDASGGVDTVVAGGRANQAKGEYSAILGGKEQVLEEAFSHLP